MATINRLTTEEQSADYIATVAEWPPEAPTEQRLTIQIPSNLDIKNHQGLVYVESQYLALDGLTRIYLDFSETTSIDSPGLAAIVNAGKLTMGTEIHFELKNVYSDEVKDCLRQTGLDKAVYKRDDSSPDNYILKTTSERLNDELDRRERQEAVAPAENRRKSPGE
jgi:anti-anti-sigma factor